MAVTQALTATPATEATAMRRFFDQLTALQFPAATAYSAGTTYALNDYVTSAGTVYLSLANGNVGNTPISSPASWRPYGVRASSDGTTYLATGNQITTDSGAGSLANTNAWAVWRMPGTGANGVGYHEYSYQRCAAAQWRVKECPVGFAAGSPGATRTPAPTTSTDEVILHGGGTDASPTGTQLFPADAAWSQVILCDSTTKYFAMLAYLNSTTTLNAVLGCFPMKTTTYDAGELAPWVSLMSYNTAIAQLATMRNTADYSVSSGRFHAWKLFGGGGSQSSLFTGSCSWAALGLPGQSASGSREIPMEFGIDITGSGPVYQGTKGVPANVLGARAFVSQAAHLSHLPHPSGNYYVRGGDMWFQCTSTAP